MVPSKIVWGVLAIVSVPPQTYGLDNGLGLTPPLGWSSWNFFATGINEKVVLDIGKAMVSLHLSGAVHPAHPCRFAGLVRFRELVNFFTQNAEGGAGNESQLTYSLHSCSCSSPYNVTPSCYRYGARPGHHWVVQGWIRV